MESNHLNKKESTGFKTPKDYFDTFEERLFNRLTLKDEKSTSPELEATPGFSIPDNYLASFDAKLMNRIKEEPKGKVISLFTTRKLMVAASITILMVVSAILFFQTQDNNITPDFEIVSSEVYEEYLSDDNVTIDIYDLASLYEEDLNELENIDTNAIEDEQLLDYLSNEELSDELIENL